MERRTWSIPFPEKSEEDLQIIQGILKYLRWKHDPLAILVIGSYAEGTNEETSDFDAYLFGKEPNIITHDYSTVNGVVLQAEIYPTRFYEQMTPQRMCSFYGAWAAYDPNGLAAEFLQEVNAAIRQMPCKTYDHKRQLIEYLEKMLGRAAKQDVHGDLRGHKMLVESLEVWCDVTDRVYLGPKKSLRIMEQKDADSFRLYRQALRSFAPADIHAWVSRLRNLLQTESQQRFRTL